MANKIKLTAVVLQYYPERIQNIPRIISDLENSSRPPDKIIVLNNNPKIKTRDHIPEDVVYIETTFGFLGRAKYIICLLDFSDYYVLIDDDMSVSKNTLFHLLSVIPNENRPFCTAQQGVILDGKLFHERRTITDIEITKAVETETLIGSFIFCSFSAIVKMLSYEQECRAQVRAEGLIDILGDDLLMGFANAPIIIYPAKEDEKVIDLSDGGVCCHQLYKQGEMSQQRDKITKVMQNMFNK